MKDGLYFYSSMYREYCDGANESIRKIPARDGDLFFYVTCAFNDEVGFSASEKGRLIANSFIDRCFTIDSGKIFLPATRKDQGIYCSFAFSPKGNKLHGVFQDYNIYLMALKKYLILFRHKEADPPSQHVLDNFVRTGNFDVEAYDLLMDLSYFVIRRNLSGEHGSVAYEIFTRHDRFAEKVLETIRGVDINFYSVSKRSELPFF